MRITELNARITVYSKSDVRDTDGTLKNELKEELQAWAKPTYKSAKQEEDDTRISSEYDAQLIIRYANSSMSKLKSSQVIKSTMAGITEYWDIQGFYDKFNSKEWIEILIKKIEKHDFTFASS